MSGRRRRWTGPKRRRRRTVPEIFEQTVKHIHFGGDGLAIGQGGDLQFQGVQSLGEFIHLRAHIVQRARHRVELAHPPA